MSGLTRRLFAGLTLLLTLCSAAASFAAPSVAALLSSPKPRDRILGLRRLDKDRGPRSTVQIVELLSDPHPGVRTLAAALLGRRGCTGCQVRLAPLLGDRSRSVRRSALRALRQLDGRGPRARPLLLLAAPSLPGAQDGQLAAFCHDALEQAALRTSALLLDRGEGRVLTRKALQRHLRSRKLTALAVEPALTHLRLTKEPGGSTTIEARLNLVVTRFPRRTMLFALSRKGRLELHAGATEAERAGATRRLLESLAGGCVEDLERRLRR